ncbi:MAG: NAD(P)/FAD-dependent oxidoreductase [Deltaproteobacteria bacterium]|nr:NAD(P)/FAD-dependent oxidoreductase [Deltaproteobacteria bacterium]
MTTAGPPPIDLLVVGRGPAGAACALQAHRDGLRVLLVGDEPIGGLVRAARRLDNLPGLARTAGADLAIRIEDQLRDAGVPTRAARVVAITRKDDWFAALAEPVATDGPGNASQGRAGLEAGTGEAHDAGRESRWTVRAICLATGTRPRAWPPAAGCHVVRDARALPPSLDARRVVVVGGGEAALDTALCALDRGAHVTILARGGMLHGSPALLDEVRASRAVVRLGTVVTGASRAGDRWTIRLGDGGILEADVLAACVGREPRLDLWNSLGQGPLDASVEQPRAPGVFAAGDLIRGRDRYVATAMGDGQRAALAAAASLGGVRGVRAVREERGGGARGKRNNR